MKCPRCGEEMTGGICDNCGFPLTKMRKKFNNGNKHPSWKRNARIQRYCINHNLI